MKLLAISDFHGKLIKLNKKELKFDVVISSGDFSSAEKIRQIHFDNWEDERRWYDIVGKTKAKKIVKIDLSCGKRVLNGLNRLGTCFVVPGNAEYTGGDSGWKLLDKDYYSEAISKLKNVIDVEYALYEVGDYQIIGYGKSSAPEKQVSKKMYKALVKALGKLFKQAKKDKKPVIFISHNTPYGILDKVTWKESPACGEHVGSDVARKIIKKYKPLLCVCGHMHENQGVERLGKTVVVNCGYGYDGQYALISLDGENIGVKLVKKELKKKLTKKKTKNNNKLLKKSKKKLLKKKKEVKNKKIVKKKSKRKKRKK